MKRIAAPMIGGIFSSFLLELMVYPVIYEVWKWNFELKLRDSHDFGLAERDDFGLHRRLSSK